MHRFEVADALEEMGRLLEFLGENPFRARAYVNGARVLRELEGDFGALVRSGEIRNRRGIGPALADKIETLLETGRLDALDELRAKVPPALLEWTRVPGLGPQRAMAVHQALGIRTLTELEDACRRDRLRDLPGFGPATQARILAGIERLRRNAGRHLATTARAEASRLLERMRRLPGVLRAEPAGSVRRCCETAGGVDVVASAAAPPAVIDEIVRIPWVRDVVEQRHDGCRVRLASGLPGWIRVVSAASFGSTLLESTGSREHVDALRDRARERELTLSDGALLDAGGRMLPCPDEQDAYAALGLPWIPPELREGRGEIESALAGTLPRLVEPGDLQGILHVHTDWSDGRVGIREMAEAVRGMGLSYLGLCDHSRSAAYAGGMSLDRLRRQGEEIDRVNAEYGGAFQVLRGAEVDILPDGTLDYPDEILAGLDLVIASVHNRFTLTEEEQTRRVLRAISHPSVDVLGHPTGRLLLSRDPYPIDIDRVLDEAARHGVAVEINAHPERLDLDWRSVRTGLERGMKTSVNPDAHTIQELSGIDVGLGIARKGWCTAADVLDAWPVETLLDWIRERRGRRDAGSEVRP